MRYQQQNTPTNTTGNDSGFLSWGETVTRVAPSGIATGRVSWPDAVAYREAIQNPEGVLADPDLRRSEVIVDRRGLPVAYAGRFAIVFRLRSPDNSSWALRCFTSAPPAGPGQVPRERRYQLVAQHTARMPEAFVPYRFVERGIKVGAEWFPVVAMRWAKGEPLGRYVERNLDEPETLRTLAGSLSGVLARLEEAGIAHGDWQHDNLLVGENGRRVTLVDYDGMYVPELAGHPSDEMGHPNYQHPARTAAHYGPGLDRFPCLVIQTALLALARDPSLWHRFSDGESLLFKRQDFTDPARSPLFITLRNLAEHARDEQLADSLARLQDACVRDPADVLPPAVAPIEFTPAPEEEVVAVEYPAGLPAMERPPAPRGGKWWLGGNAAALPPLGELLTVGTTTVTTAPSLSASRLTSSVGSITPPQDTFAFIEKAVHPDTLKLESKHLWGARAGLAIFLAFFAVFVASLLSGGRMFPFYLFFWVFNLASLGYGNWPRKKVYDELLAEIARMEKLAAGRREEIARKRSALTNGSPALTGYRSVDDYVVDRLRQVDINRVLADSTFGVTTLRQLRAEGITNALHARQRAAIPNVPSNQLAALQNWVRELEMEFAGEYRRLNAPQRQVPVDVARLEQEAAEFDRERDRLLREKELFPDVAFFPTYVARLFGRQDAPKVTSTTLTP